MVVITFCLSHFRSQFGHKEAATPISGKGKKILEKTPKRSRKNVKKSNAKEAVQDSANWVNPKSSANIPKDAGKRRVQANNRATGHWYTNADGKKVTGSNCIIQKFEPFLFFW